MKKQDNNTSLSSSAIKGFKNYSTLMHNVLKYKANRISLCSLKKMENKCLRKQHRAQI